MRFDVYYFGCPNNMKPHSEIHTEQILGTKILWKDLFLIRIDKRIWLILIRREDCVVSP